MHTSKSRHIYVYNIQQLSNTVRRGTVRSIWSDKATNFVGTRNELQQGFKEMNCDKMKNFLQENRGDWIDWHHNPPAASHMGDIWKSQIRTATDILEGPLQTHSLSLNDKSLRNLMTEVELIRYSRPQ